MHLYLADDGEHDRYPLLTFTDSQHRSSICRDSQFLQSEKELFIFVP